MKSAYKIERLAKKIRFKTDPDIDKKILDLAKDELKQKSEYKPNTWRMIMKSRITKLVAAAVFILAIAFGINHFAGSLDPASVAWADLAQRVQKIQTCFFRGHTKITGDKLPKETEIEMEMYVSSQYGFRIDIHSDENIQISQYLHPEDKAMFSVMHDQKQYTQINLADEQLQKMRQQQYDPREMVSQFMSAEYTELGRDVFDGIEVEGIETTDPKAYGGVFDDFVARLWVDVKTNLPVRLEIEMQVDSVVGAMQTTMIMDQFQWDIDLDPEIFTPDIPEDYTKEAELKMPTMDEEGAIKGLKLFSELSGGKYPSTMVMMNAIKEISSALTNSLSKDTAEIDPSNRLKQLEQNKGEMMQNAMTIQAPIMFYMELEKNDKAPAYYGNKVTANDHDKPLMRWKVSENEYRVIFGDLTIKNITAGQLEKLEAALEAMPEIKPDLSSFGRRMDSAKWTEGKAMAGTLATGLRAFAAEFRANYSTVPRAGDKYGQMKPSLEEMGFLPGDIAGTYFDESNYSWITRWDPSARRLCFTITITKGKGITSPENYTLNEKGVWTEKSAK